jgi:hypothetical protein
VATENFSVFCHAVVLFRDARELQNQLILNDTRIHNSGSAASCPEILSHHISPDRPAQRTKSSMSRALGKNAAREKISHTVGLSWAISPTRIFKAADGMNALTIFGGPT